MGSVPSLLCRTKPGPRRPGSSRDARGHEDLPADALRGGQQHGQLGRHRQLPRPLGVLGTSCHLHHRLLTGQELEARRAQERFVPLERSRYIKYVPLQPPRKDNTPHFESELKLKTKFDNTKA